MAKISSRTELTEYCLRRLGYPVIEINVTDEQIDDRIDDAFQMYTQYHFDATETVYWKHDILEDDLRRIDENGQRYLNVAVENSKNIISVIRAFPLTTLTSGSYLFDVKYSLFLNNLWDFSTTTLQYYSTVRQHLRNIELMFNTEFPIRYNRHKGRLYLDTNWETSFFNVGQTIILETYSIIDPDEFTGVYNDMWLKLYTTALIRRQWGENLRKFQGIALPGGVALNGDNIFMEANNEIARLEAELHDKYTLPANFFIG